MQHKNIYRLKRKSGVQQKTLPNSWMVRCVDRSPKLMEVQRTCNWFYSRTLLGEEDLKVEKWGEDIFVAILRNLLNMSSAFLAFVFSKTKKPTPNLVTLATASMAFLKQYRRGICPQEKKKLPLKQKIWWTCPGPSCPGNWDQCPLHIAIWNIAQVGEWSLPSAFCLDFKISKYFAIRGYLKGNYKHQRPLPVKILMC